jgi:G3E family GTPase
MEFSQPVTFGTFFSDQVMNADLIIANKIDTISSTELAKVSQRLLILNPSTLSVATSF